MVCLNLHCGVTSVRWNRTKHTHCFCTLLNCSCLGWASGYQACPILEVTKSCLLALPKGQPLACGLACADFVRAHLMSSDLEEMHLPFSLQADSRPACFCHP